VATFYRIIKSNRSTRWDFQSAQERGQQFRRPLDPESLRISFGISVYDSLDAAIANARLRPYLGTHVVPIEIEDDGPIRAEQTTRKRHHHTLFGPADEILHRAGSPIPIAEYTETMTYDLWDVESGNIVNTFETEGEALHVVRTLLDLNGPEYARSLSLGIEDDDGSMRIVAEGVDLATRAAKDATTKPVATPGGGSA